MGQEIAKFKVVFTGELFEGTPDQFVTHLRETNRFLLFRNNDEFMREWSMRAELFTDIHIEWTSAEGFVASNVQAGLFEIRS